MENQKVPKKQAQLFVNILIFEKMKSTRTYIGNSLEFIIDTSYLLPQKDERSDIRSSLVHSSTIIILLAGDADNLEQVKDTEYNYKCIRYIYNHDNSPDFHKIIMAVYVRSSSTVLLGLILYVGHQAYPTSFVNHMVTERIRQGSLSILPIRLLTRSKA